MNKYIEIYRHPKFREEIEKKNLDDVDGERVYIHLDNSCLPELAFSRVYLKCLLFLKISRFSCAMQIRCRKLPFKIKKKRRFLQDF